MALIYIATSPSGKQYIGQTVQSLSNRRTAHYAKSRERNSEGKYVYQSKFSCALRKYGNKINWQILYDEVPLALLESVEKWAISCYDTYKFGYNSVPGGYGGNTYQYLPPEQISQILEKISLAVKKSYTPERLKQLSARTRGHLNPMYGKQGAMLGRNHTEEAKEKIRIGKIGDANPSKRPEVKKKISRTRKVNQILKERKFPEMVEKPWGYEHILAYNKSYCYKKIGINAGHKTSLQYHDLKTETNYLVSGSAIYCAVKDGVMSKQLVGPGFCVHLTPGEIHRFEALTDIVLMEASSPEIWDVIRLSDDYNRQ